MPRTPDQKVVLILLSTLFIMYTTVIVQALYLPQRNYSFFVVTMLLIQQFTLVNSMTVDAFVKEGTVMRTYCLLSYMTCYMTSRFLIATVVHILNSGAVKMLKAAERLMCVAYLYRQIKYGLMMSAVKL
ncbi:Hypothetical_protein [Hexamita inflata]|uniref:Hypothetical_protein n=1 Tax=Hexamita inflata TaxID=28002 RepID=A0AA86PTV0_9EUKA|nr:Hypothetical protein HINF_LOCUS32351 [Hexamita inflata]